MGAMSIYHRFYGAFARTPSGELISCTGPVQDELRNRWGQFSAAVLFSPLPPSLVPSNTRPSERRCYSSPSLSLSIKPLIKFNTTQHGEELVVYEKQEGRQDETVFGVILRQPHATEKESDHVLVSLLLSSIRLFTSMPLQNNPEDPTNAIVNLFDTRLRYVTANDKWKSHGGRDYFFERVHDFVQRRATLEFCLPAFPCKSSNLEKVSGMMPDRGEQVALEYLDSFLESVERIYEPGAKLYIVSDGHVFSDCIGVDDETVDKYNAQLLSMYSAISQRRGGKNRIGFKSLIHLFKLEHGISTVKNILHFPRLPSYISTKRTHEADLSRQILDQGFKTDEAILRSRIDSKQQSTLKLYRGFSRFMQEDLSINRYTQGLSRSQLKKLSSKIAFEMIQRNEAYSNLIELLFPHHIRLSIHAHDNSGPKFGIRLFGPNVRPLESISAESAEMRSVDLLHVPTPWHNCLVEIGGYSNLIMTKSNTVKAALSSGKFRGGWIPGAHADTAGYFRLLPIEFMKAKIKAPLKMIADSRRDEWDEELYLRSGHTDHATMMTTTDSYLAYVGAASGIQ